MAVAAAVKNERITFLGSAELKTYLKNEAKKEGVSLSQLIRQRCMQKPSEDEMVLTELIKQLQDNTLKAKKSLEQGLSDAYGVLDELRSGK